MLVVVMMEEDLVDTVLFIVRYAINLVMMNPFSSIAIKNMTCLLMFPLQILNLIPIILLGIQPTRTVHYALASKL